MKKIVCVIVVIVTLVFPSISVARITCGPLVGDHMVLQQQTDVRLWGWTDRGANQTITLRTSWSKTRQKVKSDAKGRWEFRVSTPKASFEPKTLL